MPESIPAPRMRLHVWTGLFVCVVGLFTFLPLFHVVPLKEAREESLAVTFDASVFVEKFWNNQHLKSREKAVEVNQLIEALHSNPTEAAKRFGRRLGLSDVSSYFVYGQGRISAVDRGAITISFENKASSMVLIETGPVFGNAIRDGSGLFDVSDFPNSQDFNALSSEINRRVEERVLPLLKEKAKIGDAVQFLGGVEIADPATDVNPLRLTPVSIEFP